ncbi:MAG: hypothetical protein CFE28_16000 [Alphaproteobacteria bacterium PA2]|nr:MAG: hypothetical protein CFE28_16000 [Alphaproteobacteria bacterium PA2]
MAAKAAAAAKETVEAVADTASDVAQQAERRFAEAAKHFEKIVAESVEQIRAHSRTYADTTAEHLDEAQKYVSGKVKERPLAAAGAALGVGVLIGMLLAGGRSR